MGSKYIEQKHYAKKKLLQNFEVLRKWFSLILKLTKHMREREREKERERERERATTCLRL